MLGLFIFVISIALIYHALDSAQRKQGGRPLKQSPVIGCSCLFLIVFLVAIISIVAILEAVSS